MSTNAIPQSAGPVRARLALPRDFRIIPRLETYPQIVEFAQRAYGKIALLAVFASGLWYLHPHWRPLIVLLAATTAFPKYRRQLLTAGTLLWAFGTRWRWSNHPLLVQTAVVMLIAALLFWLATRFRASWFGRRPVASLLTGFALSVLLVSYFPKDSRIHSASWDLLTAAGTYLWFIAYSLLDIASKNRDPFGFQLGTYHPFWGSTNTPYAKGAAYLRRVEAKNAQLLAVCQIKGVKLLAWSVILQFSLNRIFIPLVHHRFGVPEYSELFALSAHGAAFPWYIAWASLIANFFEALAALSIFGHRIIAACRMAGFLALRNTYRPLQSRSIAEFWNRYYYYFKELLVNVFFFPTFACYFKRWRRFRLFVATFAAACFGNAFFHFFRDLNYIEEQGFWKALAGFQAYIFCTIVLATAIGISQIRKRRPRKDGWLRSRVLPTFSVVAFFCILSIFDYTDKRYPLHDCFLFVRHLFNFFS